MMLRPTHSGGLPWGLVGVAFWAAAAWWMHAGIEMTEALIILAALVAIGLAFWLWRRERTQDFAIRVPHIGPIVDGKSKSFNMPLYPSVPDGGVAAFSFPQPDRAAGHVHALVIPQGAPLTGKRALTLRFRIDPPADVLFYAQERAPEPGEMSLMIQRKGDDYRGKGERAFYRLYSPWVEYIKTGEREVVIPLTPAGWIGVHSGAPTPRQFADVLDNIAAIHICFGGGGSRAHGVFASGRASFVFLALDAD